MVLALDPNQGTIYRDGCWIWRTSVLLDDVDAADRQALFTLPTGCRILSGFIDVETADSGTALTADLKLENFGGDVELSANVDLTATGRTAIDVADEGQQTVHNSDGDNVEVVLDIDTSNSPGSDAVITVGLEVARTDYDKAN